MAIVQHNRTTVASLFQIGFLILLNVPIGTVFTQTVTYDKDVWILTPPDIFDGTHCVVALYELY